MTSTRAGSRAGVLAGHLDDEFGPGGREHGEEIEGALAVHPHVLLEDVDVAAVGHCEPGKGGGGPHVKALRVGDQHGLS